MHLKPAFLITAVFLGFASAFFRNLYTILIETKVLDLGTLTGLAGYTLLFIDVSELCLAVFVTFLVIYEVAKTSNGSSRIRDRVASTFIGCWLGTVLMLIISESLRFVTQPVPATNILGFIIFYGWSLFAAGFTGVFFVCLSAIFFAYYRENSQKRVQQLTSMSG